VHGSLQTKEVSQVLWAALKGRQAAAPLIHHSDRARSRLRSITRNGHITPDNTKRPMQCTGRHFKLAWLYQVRLLNYHPI
jgi:hypothetical protein